MIKLWTRSFTIVIKDVFTSQFTFRSRNELSQFHSNHIKYTLKFWAFFSFPEFMWTLFIKFLYLANFFFRWSDIIKMLSPIALTLWHGFCSVSDCQLRLVVLYLLDHQHSYPHNWTSKTCKSPVTSGFSTPYSIDIDTCLSDIKTQIELMQKGKKKEGKSDASLSFMFVIRGI